MSATNPICAYCEMPLALGVTDNGARIGWCTYVTCPMWSKVTLASPVDELGAGMSAEPTAHHLKPSSMVEEPE